MYTTVPFPPHTTCTCMQCVTGSVLNSAKCTVMYIQQVCVVTVLYMCVWAHAAMYVYTCMCMCRCIYMYMHMHMYIHVGSHCML